MMVVIVVLTSYCCQKHYCSYRLVFFNNLRENWTIKSSVAKLSQLKSNLVLYLKGQHTCLRTLLPTESIKHMLEQSMITWCIYPKSLLPGFTLPFRDLILPPLLWRSVVLLLWLMSPEEPLLIVIDTLMCSLPLPEEVIGGWGSTWL